MPFLEPADVVNDGDVSGFDAAMITIDRLGATDVGILEVNGLPFGDKNLYILAQ